MNVSLIVMLGEILRWFKDNFGEDINVITKNQVQKVFQYIFKQRTIMILGAKETGKTALLYFLRERKPYIEVDGKREAPNPTLGVVVIDDKVKISKEVEAKWGRITNDIPGDFRDEWKRLIANLDPHGIIYMIDGRLQMDELRQAVQELFNDVLSQYKDGLRNLAACHIFANYADEWANDRLVEMNTIHTITTFFEEVRNTPAYARLIDLRVMVSATQLAIDKNSWKETERALEHFAADLVGAKK